MKSLLRFGVLACLISTQAKTQTNPGDPSSPVTTCPNASYIIARAGMNADVNNPHFIYTVNGTSGAVSLVPGPGLRQPADPTRALDVNGVGLNVADGFFYGLINDGTFSTAGFVRFDQAYNVKMLGTIATPTSTTGMFGFINTAAGDIDRSNNYYFTAATANPAPGTPTGLALDKLFLGRISTISSLTGAANPVPQYFEIDYSASACANYISTFNTDPSNSGLKDFVFNPSTNTFFTYVTYRLPGATNFSGQMLELRPVAGSSPMRYSMLCTPVINTHTAEVSGTLIDNGGNFLVLMTDGSIGRIGSPSPNVYNGLYIPLNNATGLPNPLRGDMASCGGANNIALVWYRDWDGDGFGDPKTSMMATTQPAGYVSNNQDCNDYRVYYQDLDNDGWGSGVKLPCGLITRTGDCNDNDRRVHSLQTFYRDADGDSWGNAAVTIMVCSSIPPAGYVKNRMDCNDSDPRIRYCPSPSVTEAGNRVAPTANGFAQQVLSLAATPNPVTGITRIQYTLPAEARVNIRVLDLLGREVATVFNGRSQAGVHYATYNASKLTAGVYYCRMVVTTNDKEEVHTQKLIKSE